ncbi:MAG: right-handed parallel beta-helix repeat-containing protein [Anaerolineae bacterium]|nr:right-handed parallel beta-helix repeat-containing protein [Anaerolineae bacterium]MCI0609826.1 right-handed parallel beta-helix repeat-containing protein [Anaerolineae bacterium]
MKKIRTIFFITSILSILVSSCTPSQIESPTPTAIPTNTPKPTPTATQTPTAPDLVLVPKDQPTIQAGIDAVADGGTVLVAPGIYTEQLIISRTITLASYFHRTGDERFIKNTIIEGAGANRIITVNKSAADAKIIGFTIQNGNDGIKARGIVQILNNHFQFNKDAIDYQNGGGVNSGNVYENNSDDGIDLDGASAVTIENNTIRNNKNEGIEIRLQEYNGPTLEIIIRDNIISGNIEDGIQIIDYPGLSDRVFFIERNLIQGNAMAGLGLMDDGVSHEDFRASSIPERIYLINNTFIDNPYAVSGGDNLIALNNLFINSTTLALKNIDADSVVAYNLFWNNRENSQGTNIVRNTNLFSDPLLNESAELQQGSPGIDAGAIYFEWKSEIVLDLQSGAYLGSAPDLGAYEVNTPSASSQDGWLARSFNP